MAKTPEQRARQAEYSRQWRARNPDYKSTESTRKWRKKNPEAEQKQRAKDVKNWRARGPANPAKRYNLWTDAEMKALVEWTGTSVEFANLYGRTVPGVETKRTQLRKAIREEEQRQKEREQVAANNHFWS